MPNLISLVERVKPVVASFELTKLGSHLINRICAFHTFENSMSRERSVNLVNPLFCQNKRYEPR